MTARRYEVAAVSIGLALIVLILAAPFVPGPQSHPVPKPRTMQIVRVTLSPGPASPHLSESAAAPLRRFQETLPGAARPEPPALSRPPTALPAFEPAEGLAPPTTGSAASAEIATGEDVAQLSAYLTSVRSLIEAAISRDGRLDSGHGARELPTASLWLWVAPTGRFIRIEPAAASRSGNLPDRGIEHVLLDVATNLDHLPAPPKGLPQPIEIGLAGVELHPGALRNILEE